jgi:hypothetical protein
MADEYVFENNAETTLASAIGTAASSFSVESGGGTLFPSISDLDNKRFIVLVKEGSTQEYMTVTVRSGDVFSGITRAGDPQSFSAGATVKLVITAAILDSFIQKGVFRTVSDDPDGTLDAEYDGEEVYDSVNERWYKHTTGNTWVQTG